MTKRVYIETTIPSYLAAWPSRDLLQAARQEITREWWEQGRHKFDLCISQTVLDEAMAGDADAAKRRQVFLQDLPLLELTAAVDSVAKATIMKELGEIVAQCGYELPILCTPEELLGA